MQELKVKSICEKCRNFGSAVTLQGFPIFRCALEGGNYHKLSTVLYSEPSRECPYYTEQLVTKMNEQDFYSLANCHRRLGYGK